MLDVDLNPALLSAQHVFIAIERVLMSTLQIFVKISRYPSAVSLGINFLFATNIVLSKTTLVPKINGVPAANFVLSKTMTMFAMGSVLVISDVSLRPK